MNTIKNTDTPSTTNDPVGPKIALVLIILMIVYLFITK
jgi:hypothetical protein